MDSFATEAARVLRYAINTWQRTLCLALLIITITIPVFVFTSDPKPPAVTAPRANQCAVP